MHKRQPHTLRHLVWHLSCLQQQYFKHVFLCPTWGVIDLKQTIELYWLHSPSLLKVSNMESNNMGRFTSILVEG